MATIAGLCGRNLARLAEDLPMTNVFSKYIGTPYQPYIRAAIPPGATLAPVSKIEPAKCGKVPGIWLPEGWIGLPREFQGLVTKPSNLAAWDKWPTESVALRTGEAFVGVDLDTEHATLANAISAAAERILGPAPVRGRPGSARCLLVYRCTAGADAIARRTLAWHMAGEDP